MIKFWTVTNLSWRSTKVSSDRMEHCTFTVASTLLPGVQMEKLKLEWAYNAYICIYIYIFSHRWRKRMRKAVNTLYFNVISSSNLSTFVALKID